MKNVILASIVAVLLAGPAAAQNANGNTNSGANAAREMGGGLIARSDGIGQGAEFTLELPIIRFPLNAAQTTENSYEKHRTQA